ncbi:hypothetical protein [Glycomyces algeriensis]|uniref:Uncharacterized protein n=1 Tax=Glycomyces algeriensis TaxID=256037 RepID=A0A9W6G5N9_9ACTN|nr:hypothetical protein [Glycomyces algeriensis]MDA1367474.1 hypothetical protein [Glycomyces algeriensis]MDR7353163.1 hypothetical protein [Glycomyces algeriensis]GLI40855.1 hypothetical protein GALLR39Z86_07050 [Glycomyces algeriensis]
MSTMDPADVQRAKRRQREGDRRFLAWAIAAAMLMTGCAALFGLAVATTANMLRHSIIDSVFDERLPFPTFWGPGTLGYLWSIGMIGTLIGSIAASSLLDSYRGGEQQPRILASLATCAAAVAVVANAPTWLDPLEVGVAADPVFHEDEAWSVFGWIAYYADIWLPGLAVAIAGLVVAHAIRHYGRLRLQIADRGRLLMEGRCTKGAVTAMVLRTATNDQGQRSIAGTEVTVRFTDAHGVERWVTRFSRGRTGLPARGFAEVLFDPVRPGDDHLVFVAFHSDPAPPEWIGPEL